MKRSNNIVYVQSAFWKKRREYVKKLSTIYRIDSYGKDLNNMSLKKRINNKISIYRKYKFCLAIENSINIINPFDDYIYSNEIDEDYVTEKLFDSFRAGCIPIYFGPKTLYKYLPSNHSAIVIGEYKNITKLVDYVKVLSNNKEKLKEYFDWHNNYSKEWYYNFKIKYKFSVCKICERVKYFYYKEKLFYGYEDVS